MTREVAYRAAADRSSGEALITLLELTGPDLPVPLNFALSDADVLHNSQTYSRSGFTYKPPGQGDSGGAVGTLRIDNVDAALSRAVMGLSQTLTARLFEVLASSPNIIENEAPPFKFFDIAWNLHSLEGRLGHPNDDDEPATQLRYTPSIAPALYGI